MEERNKLTRDIQLAISLQLLATAYEEIAVIKMKLARDSVFHTRDFLSSLSEIFFNVKSSYKNHLIALMQKSKEQNKPVRFRTHQTNGRDVFVLLSANNKLFGDIVPNVFDLFKEKTLQANVDIALVGKLGKELFDASGVQKQYQYFEIPDIESTIEDLKPLITFILQYENVTVFHGKFINVITQNPVSSNISGNETLETTQEKTREYSFIFEPSIEEVLNFFEGQIFSSLFKQTVHEAELARYGSRIKAMEQAIEYISQQIGTLTHVQKRMNLLIADRKQHERFAGMSLWLKAK